MLTPREQQIIRSAAAGETAPETAARLGVSVETVRSHRKAVLAKLRSRTITQAVARYYLDRAEHR